MQFGRKYMFTNLEKKQAVELDPQMAYIHWTQQDKDIKTTVINMLMKHSKI